MSLDSFVKFHPVNPDRSKVLSLEIDLLRVRIRLERDHAVFDDLLLVVDLDQDGPFFDFDGEIVPLIERKELALNEYLFLFLQG